jgi:hypothetical protein
MLNSFPFQKYILILLVLLTGLGFTNAEEPNGTPRRSFQFLLPPPESSTSSIQVVADALGFQNWPQTDVWRVAPNSDRSMLIHPEKITREDKSYRIISLGQDCWGSYKWKIEQFIENDKPLPTELPEERENNLLQRIAPELRNDPNYVKKYLDEKLERYRQSQKYHNSGLLEVEICNAPNSKAAHECLLINITANTMTPAMVISLYSNSEKLSDLGTMSYVHRGNNSKFVDFVRDNIFVTIRGDGEFSDEALPLARKIDSAIIKGPSLTYEQLISRRPLITIAPLAEKMEGRRWQKSISYNVSTPNDVNVVNTTVLYGDKRDGVTDGKIIIPDMREPTSIKLLAITSELLVGQCERMVDVPDSNEETSGE